MHESLSEAFEAVQKVMGPSAFWDLACAYAVKYPSKHYNLSMAGKNLPEFLKTWPVAAQWPFLSDLAEFEWKVMAAFHAFDEKPFELSSLAGMPAEDWEKIRMVFQPSAHLIRSAWPVLDIWNARKKPVGEIKIDLAGRPQNILVFRQDTEVHTRVMEPNESAFFAEMKKGTPLGKAVEKIALSEEEIPSIQKWFQFWALAGLIIRCETSARAVKV